ncbi:TIFY 4B-like protein isoform X2, partial [Tanacetum coccineum]
MTATSSPQPPLSTTMTARSSPSPLDKPLHLLTEDDISQVTREQCRTYLTRKGMRRPSWNKSQAIQQVIMLKALLEPVPECDDVSRKLHNAHRKHQTLTTPAQKVTSADTEVSVSADDSVPGQRDEIDQSDVARDDDFVSPGITSITEEEKGQMTIFYSGKVNVYNEVPAEKLAASPLQFPPEAPVDGTGPLTCHLQAPCIRASTGSSAMILTTLQT